VGLAIEIDGYSHDLDGYRDASRDAVIAEYGVQVLRFSNQDVFENIEGVLIRIEQILQRRMQMRTSPPPAPPANGRGE
jgi:very-short-patch-repair endonuclease